MKCLVDFYKGFDNVFFFEEDRIEAGENYKSLLNTECLNQVLLNQQEPEELPESFYEGLIGLMQAEKTFGTMLKRTYYMEEENETVKEFLDHICLKQKSSSQMGERTLAHLVRLKFPAFYECGGPANWGGDYGENIRVWTEKLQQTICPLFADEFVEHYPEFDLYSKYCAKSIGGEGDAVFMFWTLAPYIHLDLKQRGESASESISKLMSWVVDSKPDHHFPKIKEFKHTKFDYFGRFILDRPLGLDERMPTHLRARLLSKVISREL